MSQYDLNIQRLPLEVLQHIFILSSNPSFPLVSRNFHKAANSQASVKTQWLLHYFQGKCKSALQGGLKWRFFNKEILNQLDNIYYQQNLKIYEKMVGSYITKVIPQPEKIIPYENRIIPQRFFSSPDPDGRLIELTKILLDRGASPNEPQGYPIAKSVQRGNIKMAKLLIQYKAKIDAAENLALKLCVARNNLEMAKLLLDNGARAEDSFLATAVKKGFWEMKKLLKDYGATENAETINAFQRR
ncbi:11589_t:CDS:1 [Diversispora eburnea]|uniref:11589_t:CDS:1 n=1 Tax=Diversispora eburnea TaxID=1213867 RepID=A0A9N9AGE2_9GLOM|nr:11589_t:CDS:1 [Diversispora eburnea]